MAKQAKNKFFKSREDVVSMFLGLVVVVAVVGFLVNFIEKRKGNIDVPGVSNDIRIDEEAKSDEESNENIVVVQKNDSLWKIAVREYGDGYKWTEIAKVNNLSNPGLIYSGQKLNLPKIEEAEAKLSEKIEYKVVEGDSLWQIAVREYGDGYKWTEIWQNNKDKLNSPDMLEIGMILSIYGKI